MSEARQANGGTRGLQGEETGNSLPREQKTADRLEVSVVSQQALWVLYS